MIRNDPLSDLNEIDADSSVANSGLPVDDPDDWDEIKTRHDSYWKADGSVADKNDHKVSEDFSCGKGNVG